MAAYSVLRVSPGGQSTLTTNTAPMGTPNLDDPTDIGFLPNGDIVITDESFTAGRPDVVEAGPGPCSPRTSAENYSLLLRPIPVPLP